LRKSAAASFINQAGVDKRRERWPANETESDKELQRSTGDRDFRQVDDTRDVDVAHRNREVGPDDTESLREELERPVSRFFVHGGIEHIGRSRSQRADDEEPEPGEFRGEYTDTDIAERATESGK
jgi:hypothetical protein